MPFRKVNLHLPRWVVVVLIGAPFFMAGLGAAAVVMGQNRADKTCEAVQGVRDDLVHSLKVIEGRALKQAKTPQQEALIKDAYEGPEGMITLIGDPACP